MKKIGVILILGLLIFACNSKEKPSRPDNLIAKDKMEHILYDLYIMNAAKGVNRKILENNGVVPETYVLTKHNIDSVQFANSNTYYAFNADEYKAMVENVKARLEKEKIEFEELEKIEGQAAKRRRDSIAEANRKKKDSITKALKTSGN
ncbi:DUF4296 domain-containing protein [Winogradskyella sp.]|uniref:DUF4296 domain-containing protein n=1 Tax=Winogradskyella sp. TaxID=1883156 RepID=UPI0035119A75